VVLGNAVFFDNLTSAKLSGIDLIQNKIYNFFGIDVFTKRRKAGSVVVFLSDSMRR
jgi:beta-N-acetylglucosaminidase